EYTPTRDRTQRIHSPASLQGRAAHDLSPQRSGRGNTGWDQACRRKSLLYHLVNHRQGQTTRPQSTSDVGSIYKDGDDGARSNDGGYGWRSGGGRGGKVVSSLQIWPLGSYVEPDLSVAGLAEGPLGSFANRRRICNQHKRLPVRACEVLRSR